MPNNNPPSRRRGKVTPSTTRPVEDATRLSAGAALTTDQGIVVSDDQNSLRAGVRGPSLLEDFALREKITHFDHERIPERVVHARGAAAHGVFQVYESLGDVTSAAFLQDPAVQTPVFVRFSTVAGSRGSADTVRDVRGFATKFYTSEGNFDLVGNNIPVFFIQDAIKFPDLVHALKPEPDSEMPQAQSAHDTFWDFIWLTPESAHMVMWLMSDRAIPRSFAMMEGFGVHTFRLVDGEGVSRFVKFHWKPVLGIHSLVWDEAQQLAGKDPDFLRRDLWDAIERGNYPEFELAIQVIEEADEDAFPFDVLDATKLWPEELVPLRRVGRLTLNRNPANFFAETEQVAFDIGNLVPGIDVSNDPLLQGRLFSYVDTQLTRLGGPNFAQLPINQAIAPVHHNQRDGFHQIRIESGKVSYSPNSLQGGHPLQQPDSGYASYPAPVDGLRLRERSASFADHFGQATLFWNSMSEVEQDHIIAAFRFELGKVKALHVRERVIDLLTNVDVGLAVRVASGIGVLPPTGSASRVLRAANARLREGWDTFGSTAVPGPVRPIGIDVSAALSQLNSPHDSARGRKVAILAADGVDAVAVGRAIQGLQRKGIAGEVVSLRQGPLVTTGNADLVAEHTVLTMPSVGYDAVYVPGGAESVAALSSDNDAVRYVGEAYRHAKPIAGDADAMPLLNAARIPGDALNAELGVLVATTASAARALPDDLATALSQHRFFGRPALQLSPANHPSEG